MVARTLIAAVSLAALGLASCSNAGRGSAGASGVCKPFPTTTTQTTTAQTTTAPPTSLNATGAPTTLPANAGDPSAALDDCLHRWGYTLAASSDPANFVAGATLAACSTQLSNWNQTSLSADNAGGAVQAPSLLTGQPTTPIGEHHNFAEGRALFYVVQARAGHCGPPPAGSTATNP